MSVVEITIANRIASAPAGIELVCNNPTDTIQFKFDDEWASYDLKTARFSWANSFIDVVFSGNTVQVPELMNTLYVFVGVYSDGIASTPVKLQCKRSILCLGDNEHLPPEHTNWDEFRETLEALNNSADEANEAAERAENATSAANSATTNAVDATTAANNSASAANEAAEAANNAAANANEAADAAVRTDALQELSLQQKDTAQENIGLKEIVKGLTDGFEASGNPVQCNPVGGMLFEGVETEFLPKQEGSGDPSPENVCPISGWDALGLVRCGKNLFDGASFVRGGIINGTGIASSQAERAYVDFLYLDKGTYIVSTLGDVYPGRIHFYGSADESTWTGSYLLSDKLNGTGKCRWTKFTLDDPCYIRILFVPDNYDGSITALDMLKASNPVLGIGDSRSVQIGQMVYGGRMNWLTGELTAGWGVVDLGSLEWVRQSGSSIAYFRPGSTSIANLNMSFASYDYNQPGELICEMYPVRAWNQINRDTDDFIALQQDHFAIKDMSYADVASFKAAMAGVMMAYPLASPTTIRLTPHQIAALQGVNTLYGDGDTIIVNGRQPKAIALEERIAALESFITTLET